MAGLGVIAIVIVMEAITRMDIDIEDDDVRKILDTWRSQTKDAMTRLRNA